jgi:serine/threonine-protein kinase
MRYCERCGASFQALRTCPRDRIATRADLGDPLIGNVLGGRYRILDRIGAGGMGQVYRAAHTRIACIFAVKVLYGELIYESEMRGRFVREAELASALQSRHIVRVVDFNDSDTAVPYIAMEFLDGPTLHDLVTREGALPPARAVPIARHIALGLLHAHERGVVHRDLKSENVLVVREDDDADVAKILDFGVARLRDGERMTRAGVVMGTPHYMAPEQFAGAEIDARADLYSLGVLLFETLAGRVPFDAVTIPELARQHVSAPPPSLRNPLEPEGVDPELDAIVQRLLAKQPADRYASARELVQALNGWLARAAEARKAAPPSLASSRPSQQPRSATQAAVEREVLAAIESAIVKGAPTYNAGDHAACYALYRETAETILNTMTLPIAVSARLRAGLRRAATRTAPTPAAWDLRYAFDDLLLARPVTTLHGDPLLDELAIFSALTQAREGAGQLDLLGDVHLELARGLSALLAGDPRRQAEAAALAQAVAEGERLGGGQAAHGVVSAALEPLASGGSGAFSPTVATPLPVEAAAAATLGSSSVEIAERIGRAIRVGAPAYNAGRADLCYRVYRETAQDIVHELERDPSGEALARWLASAIARAAERKNPSDAAWTLRHAFDALLAIGPARA